MFWKTINTESPGDIMELFCCLNYNRNDVNGIIIKEIDLVAEVSDSNLQLQTISFCLSAPTYSLLLSPALATFSKADSGDSRQRRRRWDVAIPNCMSHSSISSFAFPPLPTIPFVEVILLPPYLLVHLFKLHSVQCSSFPSTTF